MVVLLVALCGISFYLGGVFYSEKEKDGYATNDVSKEAESFEGTAGGGSLQTEDTSLFPECSPDFQDYTPCTDPKVFSKPVSWCGVYSTLVCLNKMRNITEVEEIRPTKTNIHGTPLPASI